MSEPLKPSIPIYVQMHGSSERLLSPVDENDITILTNIAEIKASKVFKTAIKSLNKECDGIICTLYGPFLKKKDGAAIPLFPSMPVFGDKIVEASLEIVRRIALKELAVPDPKLQEVIARKEEDIKRISESASKLQSELANVEWRDKLDIDRQVDLEQLNKTLVSRTSDLEAQIQLFTDRIELSKAEISRLKKVESEKKVDELKFKRTVLAINEMLESISSKDDSSEVSTFEDIVDRFQWLGNYIGELEGVVRLNFSSLEKAMSDSMRAKLEHNAYIKTLEESKEMLGFEVSDHVDKLANLKDNIQKLNFQIQELSLTIEAQDEIIKSSRAESRSLKESFKEKSVYETTDVLEPKLKDEVDAILEDVGVESLTELKDLIKTMYLEFQDLKKENKVLKVKLKDFLPE